MTDSTEYSHGSHGIPNPYAEWDFRKTENMSSLSSNGNAKNNIAYCLCGQNLCSRRCLCLRLGLCLRLCCDKFMPSIAFLDALPLPGPSPCLCLNL